MASSSLFVLRAVISTLILSHLAFTQDVQTKTAQTNETASTPEPTPEKLAPENKMGSEIYTRLASFGHIDCANDMMKIVVGDDQLLTPPSSYMLLDGKCRPKTVDGAAVFDFKPLACGTNLQSNETHWIYSNTVSNVDPRFPPMPRSVQTYRHQKGTFRCVYPRIMRAKPVSFVSKAIDYEYPISGETTATVKLDLFTDEGLSNPVNLAKKLKLKSTLYAVASRRSDDNSTFLVPIKCFAYSQADPSALQPILNNGCWVNKDFQYFKHTKDMFSFKFPVFGFVALGDRVKMECVVSICKVGQTQGICKIPTKPCDFGPSNPVLKKSPIVRRADLPDKKADKETGVVFSKSAVSFSIDEGAKMPLEKIASKFAQTSKVANAMEKIESRKKHVFHDISKA